MAQRLLLIRHAIAEEREAFAHNGEPDDLRPLTDRGRQRMRLGAIGLHALVGSIDRLGTSPLVRARETAAIVGAVFGADSTVVAGLAPAGSFDAILKWAAGADRAALVGHEPDLGEFACWLLSGERHGFMPLKKGAACLLTFDGEPVPGRARLEWLLTPKQLRLLGHQELLS